MEKFIQELNNLTENKYEFMLKSALLDRSADFCVIEILYKDGIMISAENKSKIQEAALSILPKEFKYSFEFVKRYISEERVTDDLLMYLNKNFPSISYSLKKVERKETIFEMELVIDELSFEHAEKEKLPLKIEEYFRNLYSNFDYKCVIRKDNLISENHEQNLKENYKEEEVDIFANRKIAVTEIVELVGEKFDDATADYISDKTKEQTAVVVCGKVKGIKAINLKPRQKKIVEEDTETEPEQPEEKNEKLSEIEEQNKEPEIKYQRKMYKFSLVDFTGEMSCVFFSNKENQSKLEKLEDGSVIIVRGNLSSDKFSGGLVLTVKDIAYCSLPEKFEEYIEYRKEKPFYEFVQPEKITTYAQDDILSFASQKETPNYLKDKVFVCYDFETTGLHYGSGDRIIEIGAVKIVNGKITERFMSYVDPEKHIPEESSAISGIVDADVAGAPKAGEVLQDFYKFTRGAIIIGYNNINFDNVFLIGQGKTARWNFDNETDDVFAWAQKYVRGVKNYKLKTIADKLGVVLDNAHRAVFDALATAEVFIKIQEIYNEDIKTK